MLRGLWKPTGGVADLVADLVPRCLPSDKTSRKTDHVLQSNWSMKMVQYRLCQLFLCNFSNLCFPCIDTSLRKNLDTAVLLGRWFLV